MVKILKIKVKFLFSFLLVIFVFLYMGYSYYDWTDISPNGKCFYFNNNQNTTSFYISTNCGKVFGLYNPTSYISCPSVIYSNYPAHFSCFSSSLNEYGLLYYFNDEDFILFAQPIPASWSSSLPKFNATDYWGYQKDHMFGNVNFLVSPLL